jgi:hypothetical protein
MSQKIKPRPGYMIDRFGDEIPNRLISSYDKKRDQIVRRILKRYEKARADLEKVQAETLSDLDTLEEAALADANVNDFRAKGGNVTVSSYDGLITVRVKNRVFSAMDERASIAKNLLDEFVAELTEGQEKSDIVQIVNSLLDTPNGGINRTAALRVLRLNLKSEKFRKAKELLADSMYASQSKSYIYVERRADRAAEPEQIVLDIAKIMPAKEIKPAP